MTITVAESTDLITPARDLIDESRTYEIWPHRRTDAKPAPATLATPPAKAEPEANR